MRTIRKLKILQYMAACDPSERGMLEKFTHRIEHSVAKNLQVSA